MIPSFKQFSLNEGKVKVAGDHVKVTLTKAQKWEYGDTFFDTLDASMPDDYYGTMKGNVLTIPKNYVVNTAERLISLYDPIDEFGDGMVPKRVKASLYKLGKELLATAK